MRKKLNDWIALIEAGYDLKKNEESWLEGILDRASPLFKRGFWPTIGIYNYTPSGISLEYTATRGPVVASNFLQSSIQVKTEAVADFFRSAPPVCSLSETVYLCEPEIFRLMQDITAGQVKDKLAVKALTGQGNALIMCWLFANTTTPTTLERKRWTLIAAHLAAGLRLRKVAECLTLENASVEAVFDSSGKLHDARKPAAAPLARNTLREAVRRIDRLRTRSGRSDPDASMQAWSGLVHGRWSIVDYFDSDQRRFIVAIKNDPHYLDPRGLTMRERQVAEFVGSGMASKAISYTLGISSSAVTNCTASAQIKLGLTSREELVAFFAPCGLRNKLAEISIAGEDLLVGNYPLIDEQCVSMFTEAERAVLAFLVSGSTGCDIAKRRNTSESTVAKQIQMIFQKLGVHSRSELVARLLSKE